MPAKSKKQRRLMGLAASDPGKVKPSNRGVLKMTKSQLHDFASTDEKGLPVKVKKEKKQTTTIKPDAGPVADKEQRKQIKDIIK